MSSILGLGGTGTLTTTESTVFDYGVDLAPNAGNYSTVVYTVKNNDSTNDALIRLAGLNGASNWVPINPGDKQDFVLGPGTNKIIYGKSSSGSVVISGGPTGSV